MTANDERGENDAAEDMLALADEGLDQVPDFPVDAIADILEAADAELAAGTLTVESVEALVARAEAALAHPELMLSRASVADELRAMVPKAESTAAE